MIAVTELASYTNKNLPKNTSVISFYAISNMTFPWTTLIALTELVSYMSIGYRHIIENFSL